LVIFAAPLTWAASLSLTSIGALNTAGNRYSEWWYTGTSPLLMGTAGNGDEVTINVNGDSHKATADSSGNWSYQTSLDKGDYPVTIASGSESYGFTLHLGQSVPANVSTGSGESSQSTGSVPTTGYPMAAGLAISVGLLSAGAYAYIKAKRNTKKAYVKSVLDSVDQ
jgi:hypothetical protein